MVIKKLLLGIAYIILYMQIICFAGFACAKGEHADNTPFVQDRLDVVNIPIDELKFPPECRLHPVSYDRVRWSTSTFSIEDIYIVESRNSWSIGFVCPMRWEQVVAHFDEIFVENLGYNKKNDFSKLETDIIQDSYSIEVQPIVFYYSNNNSIRIDLSYHPSDEYSYSINSQKYVKKCCDPYFQIVIVDDTEK
jgi:hypothetical protein